MEATISMKEKSKIVFFMARASTTPKQQAGMKGAGLMVSPRDMASQSILREINILDRIIWE